MYAEWSLSLEKKLMKSNRASIFDKTWTYRVSQKKCYCAF